jgi:hypothetical protein
VYKVVFKFEVLRGKLAEMKEILKRLDEERTRNDPTYKPIKRYVSVYGNTAQVFVEVEMEELPKEPRIVAEVPEEGAMGESFKLMVPGRDYTYVLKELDLS